MTIKEIKKYVKIHKIKYKTIAENSGISIGTLRNIFSNAEIDPRASTVEKIEKAIGICSVSDIAEKYYTVDEENLIVAYRKLSARDKKIVLKVVDEMKNN
ncbi:MAG: helix-turn-helix transcriptional regulator [Clostridia bacterium]|nr:helix-turn-helix transcriptional regulator [Clostridia bacterium]